MLKTIKAPIRSIAEICGSQTYMPGETYRVSRYCIEAECVDGVLLYHTLTGEILLCDDGAYAKKHEDELIRKWYLVPEGFQEKKYTDKLRSIMKAVTPAKGYKDSFTVVTTTDCNARCYYCFENKWNRVPMGGQVAKDAALHIIHESKGHAVTLHWFGGEPLYNIDAIDCIVDVLSERGIAFQTDMVSNGYFLTADVAQKAKKRWNLQHVQITIDGTEPVYNRRKAYRNACENPFQRVLDNIGFALDEGISVLIRLNLDEENASDLMCVLDVLASRFSGEEKLRVGVQLLRSYSKHVMEFTDAETALQTYDSLTKKAWELGLSVYSPMPNSAIINKCMADNDACEVILPDGRIGKCHHVFDRDWVGNIYDDDLDADMIRVWKKEKLDIPECDNCPYYPFCINLQKCEKSKDGCSEITRMLRMTRIQEQITAFYERFVKTRSI